MQDTISDSNRNAKLTPGGVTSVLNKVNAGEMIGAVSVGAFVLTVCYLLGYSYTIKFNIFPYVGLADYLRFAVVWLGRAFFVLLIVLPVGLFAFRSVLRLIEWLDRISNRAVQVSFGVFALACCAALPFLFMLLIARTTFGLGYSLEAINGFGMAAFGLFISLMALDLGWIRTRIFLCLLVFFAMASSFVLGRDEADATRFPPDTDRLYRLSLDGEPSEMVGVPLFVLDEYTLIRRESSNVITVLRSDIIRLIEPLSEDGRSLKDRVEN